MRAVFHTLLKPVIMVFLCLVLMMCSLLVMEAALRVYFFHQSRISPEGASVSDEQIGKKLDELMKTREVSSTTFNIYYFGESTMKGAPYDDAIPILTSLDLGGSVGDQAIRWINAAQHGHNSRQVLERVRWVTEHKDIYHPTLFIIYSGHDEFLEYGEAWGFTFNKHYQWIVDWLIEHSIIARLWAETFQMYKLEIDERSLFDVPVVTGDKHDEILADYQRNMRTMAESASQHGIPVIFSTVAGNYSDFEPNRSVCTPGDDDSKKQAARLLSLAKEHLAEKQFEMAKEEFFGVIGVCGSFADAFFRIGKVYEQMGSYDDAWDFYLKAVEHDGMPIRAFVSQNDDILSLEDGRGVYAVDAVDALRKQDDTGLIGYNFMSDGHHPNLKGYAVIAGLLSGKIREIFLENETHVSTINEDVARKALLPRLDMEFDSLIANASWLLRLSTWTSDPDERLEKAEAYISEALSLIPNNPYGYLNLAIISYLKKDVVQAEHYLQIARSINAEETRKFLKTPWIAQVVLRARMK